MPKMDYQVKPYYINSLIDLINKMLTTTFPNKISNYIFLFQILTYIFYMVFTKRWGRWCNGWEFKMLVREELTDRYIIQFFHIIINVITSSCCG